MKMDVEGYEIKVLKGMSKLLAQNALRTIFFEFCPAAQKWTNNQPDEIIRLLIKSGYALYEMEGKNADSRVSAENVKALIARLGDRGYTTLLANLQSGSK